MNPSAVLQVISQGGLVAACRAGLVIQRQKDLSSGRPSLSRGRGMASVASFPGPEFEVWLPGSYPESHWSGLLADDRAKLGFFALFLKNL